MPDAYDMEPVPASPLMAREVVAEDVGCVGCGRSLAGKAADGVCECGTMVHFSRFGPDGGDGSAPIAGELICRRCGYDLAGLRAVDDCPECGMAVARSIRGDSLVNSDPGYVRTLARGALIAEWAVILTIVLYITGAVGLSSALAGVTGGGALVMAAFGTLLTGLHVANLAGWWMLTTRDPALGERDPGGRARKVLRIALIGMLAVTLLQASGNWAVAAGTGITAVVAALALASPLIWLVKIYASLAYMIMLDSRLPGADVAEQAAGARVVVNWSLGLIGATIVLAFVAPCMGVLPVLGLLVCSLLFLIRYIGMLEEARSALKRASERAAAS